MTPKKNRDNDQMWTRSPFNDLFGADLFGQEVERMQMYMDQMMHRSLGHGVTNGQRPYVRGFRVQIAQDERPNTREFSNDPNRPPSRDEPDPFFPEHREPWADIIECGDRIAVTVELPWVNKKDVDLRSTSKVLSIHVNSDTRKYFKEVQLPSEVDPDTVKATFRNGVLDITLKRVVPKGSEGKKVTIE